MEIIKNKEKFEKFVDELKKTKKLGGRYIDYIFSHKCHNYKESYFALNKSRFCVEIYFHPSDTFEKWVDVFVRGEALINDAMHMHAHYLNIPDDFEYIVRNMEDTVAYDD